MTRKWQVLLASGTAAVVGACAEGFTGSSEPTYDLSAAFASIPAGYGDVANSYVSSAANGATPWLARGGRDRAAFGTGEMMGGGLGEAFVGGIGMGRGFGHHGPFGGALGCTGTFANGRVTCDPITTPNGLTIARSAAYADAAGQVQEAFDSLTTNTVNIRSEVSGTLTFSGNAGEPGFGFGPRGGRGGHGGRGGRHGGPGGLLLGDTATVLSATTTVRNVSDRTVTGLAQGSTQRTVNGASSGEESTTGTSSRGDFTSLRVAADTTQGLVIPVQASGSYPTAGTVIRSMKVTVTYAGEEPVTQSRREVVTYDGSSTASVEITQDGATRSCTRPLPRGRLTCE